MNEVLEKIAVRELSYLNNSDNNDDVRGNEAYESGIQDGMILLAQELLKWGKNAESRC